MATKKIDNVFGARSWNALTSRKVHLVHFADFQAPSCREEKKKIYIFFYLEIKLFIYLYIYINDYLFLIFFDQYLNLSKFHN